MATSTFIPNLLFSPSSTSSSSPSHNYSYKLSSSSLLHGNKPFQESPLLLQLASQKQRKTSKSRGSSVITRAGGPSTTSYIFAFVFPLSLAAVTIFTSMRIADDLDRKFFEEITVNQEILEGEEEDTDPISLEEKPDVPRKRNRPIREVESSSSSV